VYQESNANVAIIDSTPILTGKNINTMAVNIKIS